MSQSEANYLDDLYERLRNPEEAANYLVAALEEHEPETLAIVIRDVIAAGSHF